MNVIGRPESRTSLTEGALVVWTGYTVVFMWAYANNFIPWLAWSSSPLGILWFLLLFPVLVLWQSTHLYFTHRLLHWKPLFGIVRGMWLELVTRVL